MTHIHYKSQIDKCCPLCDAGVPLKEKPAKVMVKCQYEETGKEVFWEMPLTVYNKIKISLARDLNASDIFIIKGKHYDDNV